MYIELFKGIESFINNGVVLSSSETASGEDSGPLYLLISPTHEPIKQKHLSLNVEKQML